MNAVTLILAAVLAAFDAKHGGNEMVRSRGFALHAAAMGRFIRTMTGRLDFAAECAFDQAMRAALAA